MIQYKNYANGWYRIIATSVPLISTDVNGEYFRIHMLLILIGGEAIVGNTSLFNYIWGAQARTRKLTLHHISQQTEVQ